MATKKKAAEKTATKDRPVSLVLNSDAFAGLSALAEINSVSINAFVAAQIDKIVEKHAELIKKYLAQKKLLQEEFHNKQASPEHPDLFHTLNDAANAQPTGDDNE